VFLYFLRYVSYNIMIVSLDNTMFKTLINIVFLCVGGGGLYGTVYKAVFTLIFIPCFDSCSLPTVLSLPSTSVNIIINYLP
jgi:hypothetical protein